MKCIYCNSEEDMTISDIIPAALTGAKLTRRFVCYTHNKFTNDNYESDMIRMLAPFRNLIGLTERCGDPVRYYADLDIGDRTLKNVLIKDNASVLSGDRIIRNIDSSGRTVLVGDREKLLKIKGATETNVETIEAKDFSVVMKSDLRELFISSQVLHAVSKIGYEAHCYLNDITVFQKEKYSDIVSYILSAENEDAPVELVVDPFILQMSDTFSRTGTNILFEYDDCDGYTYVVFGLWNVLLYKVRICKSDVQNKNIINTINVYFYHVDGTQTGTIVAFMGDSHIASELPDKGLAFLCADIKTRLSEVGQRDLSIQYINKNIDIILKNLPKYKSGKMSISQLLDFEHKDRVIPIFIIEQLLNEKDKYQDEWSFTKIMATILNCGERYGVTKDKLKEILGRYLAMDQEGTFAVMLESAIEYFKNRFVNKE